MSDIMWKQVCYCLKHSVNCVVVVVIVTNALQHRGPEMESSRPWPRGQLVMSLALGAKSLAMASDVVSLALASENMYLV